MASHVFFKYLISVKSFVMSCFVISTMLAHIGLGESGYLNFLHGLEIIDAIFIRDWLEHVVSHLANLPWIDIWAPAAIFFLIAIGTFWWIKEYTCFASQRKLSANMVAALFGIAVLLEMPLHSFAYVLFIKITLCVLLIPMVLVGGVYSHDWEEEKRKWMPFYLVVSIFASSIYAIVKIYECLCMRDSALGGSNRVDALKHVGQLCLAGVPKRLKVFNDAESTTTSDKTEIGS